jgi:PST family polysaccharide transporter
MLFATGGGRVITFVGQVLLGRLLTDRDFGLFAIALSVASFMQVFKDGGLRQLLIQRGRGEYQRLLGPVFWMMAVFALGSAGLLAAASGPVSRAYGEGALGPMLRVLAAALAASLPSMILLTGMYIDLRFDVLAAISTGSIALRYVLTVALAWSGLGPMSFVWPMLVCAAAESAVALVLDPDRPWRERARWVVWPVLLGESKWLIAGSLATFVLYLGNYPVIGLFATTEVVGVYSFAFLLVSQTGTVAYAVEQVLFPSLSRLRDEPERRRVATLRSLRAAAILMAPACFSLAAVYEPLELLIWHGRWAESVAPLQLLCLAYPPFILHFVSKCVLMATGRFRSAAAMIFSAGAGTILAGGIAAAVWGTPTAIAAATAGYLTAASIPMLALPLRSESISLGQILARVGPAFVLAFAAAGSAWGLDQWVLKSLHPLTRGAVGTGVAGLLTAGLFRVFIPEGIRDLVVVMPGRLGQLVSRVMGL